MLSISPEMEDLYDALVPSSGAAPTRGGEIVRAFNRLGYRFLNDGDHVGLWYGNETCNCAARFLLENVPDSEPIIKRMWGEQDDDAYESHLQELQELIVEFVTADEDGSMGSENDDDYLNYRDPADEHDFVDFYGDYEDEDDKWS